MRAFLRTLTVTILLAAGWGGAAMAEEPLWNYEKGFFGGKGSMWEYALNGYDPVSYFAEAPVKGDPQFKTDYLGATWIFASQENLDKFLANPDANRPQYGGHCAYALAQSNQLVFGDPEVWRLVDGKIYLNFDKSVQQRWQKDIPGNIAKSDPNWAAKTQ